MKKRKIAAVLLIIPFILLIAYGLPESQNDNILIAKVGDKEISLQEFYWRSELTIRPGNFKSKNITLNNLLSEKMLSLEAGDKYELLKNPVFLGQLKGIKEQMMRDELYYDVAQNKVVIDSVDLINAYRSSFRQYNLEFYTINNTQLAERIIDTLRTEPGLADSMITSLSAVLGKQPVHTIKYDDQDDDVIHESLFANILDKGKVVGPLKLRNGSFILMKVLDWVDYPVIGLEDQQIRFRKVKEKITGVRARKLWHKYQSDLMKGRRLEFNKESFHSVSDIALNYYLSHLASDSLNSELKEIPTNDININLDDPFFTIDDETWSIKDFKEAMLSHPLVFRTKEINKDNFKEQFKLAVVDMIRDSYLTQEAYSKSLDNNPKIERMINLWQDAVVASHFRNNIIEKAIEGGEINRNDNPGILRYWGSYLKNIQEKYASSIFVNKQEFGSLSLTNVDFMAVRPGVPYPVAMPSFPLLVSSEDLNYAGIETNK